MNMKQISMIAAVFLIAVFSVVPVTAAPGVGIVPPADYFIRDAPENNGFAVHDGIQQGYLYIVTADQRIQGFSESHYLGLTGKTYKLQYSHNEQEQVAMGQLYYHYTMPEVPYTGEAPVKLPVKTFTSENPDETVYEPAYASDVYR